MGSKGDLGLERARRRLCLCSPSCEDAVTYAVFSASSSHPHLPLRNARPCARRPVPLYACASRPLPAPDGVGQARHAVG